MKIFKHFHTHLWQEISTLGKKKSWKFSNIFSNFIIFFLKKKRHNTIITVHIILPSWCLQDSGWNIAPQFYANFISKIVRHFDHVPGWLPIFCRQPQPYLYNYSYIAGGIAKTLPRLRTSVCSLPSRFLAGSGTPLCVYLGRCPSADLQLNFASGTLLFFCHSLLP